MISHKNIINTSGIGSVSLGSGGGSFSIEGGTIYIIKRNILDENK